jgi:hypothetical protein
MSQPHEDTTVLLRLTEAEALVLFEWLARTDNSGGAPVEDEAETVVLWRLEGQLETQLKEVLDPDYRGLVEVARRKVRGSQ